MDRLLHQRDCFLWRPGREFTMSEGSYCKDRVTIVRDHRLVFGNGFLVSALRTEYLAFGKVHEWAAGRFSKGLCGQIVDACREIREGPMVCTTLRWRGLDSNHRFLSKPEVFLPRYAQFIDIMHTHLGAGAMVQSFFCCAATHSNHSTEPGWGMD